MKESFEGRAPGYGGDIIAKIAVEDGTLIDLTLSGEDETQDIGVPALGVLAKQIKENGGVYTDAVSGATITSAGVRDALKNAKIAAGLMQAEEAAQPDFYETELLIVGCGLSGVMAALSAGESGLQVLVAERTEVFGGNGLWANGGYFVETQQQKEAGVNYTVKEAFQEAEYFAGYLNDPILMRMVLGESAETVRWADGYGAGFYLLPYHKNLSAEGEPLCYHCWDGKDPFGHFREHLAKMDNVSIVYGLAIQDLIQENGVVVGARGTHADGQQVEIRAKAVYIGTGGYIANNEMVANAIGKKMADMIIVDAPSVSDGSGIKMAWKAGGGKCGEKLLATHGGRTGLGGKEGLPGCDLLMNLPILWVNRAGRRFMNEETIYDSLFYSNILQSQGGYAYIIFDRASVDQWIEKTIPMKMHFWDRFGENGGYYCPPVKTFDQDFKTAQEAGLAFEADDVRSLAEKMGVPADVLQKTVADYNHFVEQKEDPEFFKSAENLIYPVCEGTLYAIRVTLQAQGSCGGIRVHDSLEVVTEDLVPIPGLYAGGCDAAGGLYAGSYTVLMGMGVSWAMTSGRLAAKSAAAYIRGE